MVATFTACKETTVTDVPVTIDRIDVSSGTVTLRVGETIRVTAVARSESGQGLTARPIQWQTSDANVAIVMPDGSVTGVGVGTATLTASSEGVSTQVSVTVMFGNFTINIDNLLVSGLNIAINGAPAGVVNALTTRTFTVPGAATVSITWTLIRQTTTQGNPIGDEISATFGPINAGTNAVFTFEVDNEIGTTDTYFAPFISNTSSETLLIGANVGLASQNLCNCTLPNTGAEFFFGYYHLETDSNVRAYHQFSGYTGNFVFWTVAQINSLMEEGSGAVRLTTTIAPAGVATAAEPGFAASRSVQPRPRRAGIVHRDDRPAKPAELMPLRPLTSETRFLLQRPPAASRRQR